MHHFYAPKNLASRMIFFHLLLLLGVGGSGKAFADDTPPHVDPALCQALVKHTPSADVAYQPGVDVNGKAVAPADLPGSPQIALPKQITIPVTVQLTKLLNLGSTTYPGSALGEGTEATLGVITVEGDRVLFNGKPISDEQQDNLSVLCLKQK